MAGNRFNRKIKELLYAAGAGVKVETLLESIDPTHEIATVVDDLESASTTVSSLAEAIIADGDLFAGLDTASASGAGTVDRFREDVNASAYAGDALNDPLADLLQHVVDSYTASV